MKLIQAHSDLQLPQLAGLSDEDRQRVTTLARRFTEWLAAGRPTASFALVAGETGMSATAVRSRFHKAAKTGSMDCFVPQQRKDKGTPRNWHPLALEYLLSRAGVVATAEKAYNQTVDVAKRNGWEYGSLRSAQRYIQQHKAENATMLSLSHREKTYYDKFEKPLLRDTTTLLPNEIWVGDQMQFDVLVQYTAANGKKAVARPWLSAWLDVRTRLWVGLMVSLGPTSRAIADAMRAGILRFGMPMNFYIDNGKTYRAKILTGDRKRFEESEVGFLDPGPDVWNAAETLSRGLYGHARVIHAIIENARAKLVERYFGRGNWATWAMDMPGYTGDRYDRMPDETRRLLKQGKLMEADEFIWHVAEFAMQMNTRKSKGQGMAGLSPAEIMLWYARHDGWRPRIPQGEAVRFLDHLALKSDTRIVQKTGIQHASKLGDPVWYYHDDLHTKQLIGRRVNVRWSESELAVRRWWTGNTEDGSDGYSERLIPAKLIVYNDGTFICEAEPIEYLEYLDDPRYQEQLKKQQATKKEFKRQRDQALLFGEAVNAGALPPGAEELTPAPVHVRPRKENEFERELRETRDGRRYLDNLNESTNEDGGPDDQADDLITF